MTDAGDPNLCNDSGRNERIAIINRRSETHTAAIKKMYSILSTANDPAINTALNTLKRDALNELNTLIGALAKRFGKRCDRSYRDFRVDLATFKINNNSFTLRSLVRNTAKTMMSRWRSRAVGDELLSGFAGSGLPICLTTPVPPIPPVQAVWAPWCTCANDDERSNNVNKVIENARSTYENVVSSITRNKELSQRRKEKLGATLENSKRRLEYRISSIPDCDVGLHVGSTTFEKICNVLNNLRADQKNYLKPYLDEFTLDLKIVSIYILYTFSIQISNITHKTKMS